MNRRNFLAGMTTYCASARAADVPAVRPNVLVVMSDQESFLLPGPANLPNRQKLLDGGVEFTHAFCNTPQCSPSRASLLTGLEPHRTGVLTNVDGESIGKRLPANLPNVGSVFQAAGYRTGYFGKWHLGGSGPAAFGFQHAAANGNSTQDQVAASSAAQWIRERKGAWLAWVSLLNPHRIYQIPGKVASVRIRQGVRPPASDLSNLLAKPSEQRDYVGQDQGRQTREFTPDMWLRYRSYYLDLVEEVDKQLGEILAAAPRLNDTIVAYTSDHGDALGEHGLPYKGPFMYEEEIRVPLILRASNFASTVRSDLVTLADLAPTLASLAGVKWPGDIAGKDLTRRDLTRPMTRDAVFLEYYAKQKWVNPIRTIRTERWKLNAYDSGHRELYDLRDDPHELVNRALDAKVRAVQTELQARLDSWKQPSKLQP